MPSDDISTFYRIHEKKLGEGGFAKVRLGTHLATGLNVAIKCLDKKELGPELPRIYNEIECLKRLKHHNIARLYQVFDTPNIIYLVLEYCNGGELFDYIVKKTKLDEAEANKIFHDLVRVLDYIHINGFAHRDLKPENVLFDNSHQIKLIDFGLAANCSAENMALKRSQQPIDQLNTCCGSVTYAAPEVISGAPYSGTAVDVWSAGVMLYASLVGQLPFNDSSIPKLYQKIQAGLKDIPSFLSSDASDLIRKMLTVDPKQRITIRQILAHPWLTRNRHNNMPRVSRRLEFSCAKLDDQVLFRCCEKFPNMTLAQIKDNIQRDFNYYSTTYHLMKSHGPSLPVVVAPPPIPRSVPVKRTPNRSPVGGSKASASASDEVSSSPHHPSPTKRSRFENVTNAPMVPRTPPCYVTPTKRSRFVTVTNTPKTPKTSNYFMTPTKSRLAHKPMTPKTLPSYLKRLHKDQDECKSIHKVVRPSPLKTKLKHILRFPFMS